MNEFAIHIEYLLLSRNCVIVPSLGAFKAELVPARWIADEELFLPPTRKVQFDPTVLEDPDEVFVRSISEIEGVSKANAKKLCENYVADFHKRLVTDGSVDFGSIGNFTIGDDAVINMTTCECGIVTPTYYGLDALPFCLMIQEAIEGNQPAVTLATQEEIKNVVKEVTGENKEEEEQPIAVLDETPIQAETAQKTIETKVERTHVTIRIRRSMLQTAVSIAAILLLCLILKPSRTVTTSKQDASVNLFLQPSMVADAKSDDDTLSMLNEEATDSFDAVLVDITDEARNDGYDFDTPAETRQDSTSVTSTDALVKINKQPVLEINTSTNKSVNSSSLATENKTENKAKVVNTITKQGASINASAKPNTSAEVKNTYSVILASGVTLSNAEAFVESLKKKGVNATVYQDTNMRRVIVGGFADYQSAHKHLSSLQERGLASDGWVLKL